MKEYKIGDVVKMVGMSAGNIRFFESKGLISPKKNKYSKYRYYDLEDIHQLLDYRKYRDLGLSVTESIQAVHKGSFKDVVAIVGKRQADVEKKARYFELEALKLRNDQNLLRNVRIMENTCKIVESPEICYLLRRTYRNGELTFERDEAHEVCAQELMEHYVFVENMFRIRQEWVGDSSEMESVEEGLSIETKWLDALEIPSEDQLQKAESTQALYTIVKATEQPTFHQKALEPAFEYMQMNGYRLNGDITGNLILVAHQGEQTVRYVEVWIPIKK